MVICYIAKNNQHRGRGGMDLQRINEECEVPQRGWLNNIMVKLKSPPRKIHTHHLSGDHVIENMETYWAQVTYGNILGSSYIRYFPSCFPNTSDVKKEKEGGVPMTGHSSMEREGEGG